MKYNFDELPERKATESFKWRHFEQDVLPMWVADMDFASPEPVIRALQERVMHGVFGYPDELPGMRDLLVERMDLLYGWKIQAEDLVFMPGVVTGLNMAAQALVRPGEGLLVQPPVYMPFLSAARNVDGVTQEAVLSSSPDGYYSADWDAFESTITDQTRLFVLCNPHNPVGRVYTRPELECMAEICLRHDVTICSDEIHCDLVYSGHPHIPIASLSPEIAQNTITLMAPSKTFNIAGLGCSFAIIKNPDLRKQFQKAGKGMVHFVNLFGMVAGKAAYEYGQEWLDQLLVYLQGNRDFLFHFVNEQLPGVKMFCPEGTYLAWLDCREAGIAGKPGEFFLKKARVAMNEGDAFGRGGDGFVRLNFGCPRSMLVESLERMKCALEGK
jgi:cysteine-S-conjugate beta-lyase